MVYHNGYSRAAPCIIFNGNKQAKQHFTKAYLATHPEVGNWNDDIGYSVNKNRRWELQDNLKKAFQDDIKALKEEPFDVFAMVLPDPNTIHQQHLKQGVASGSHADRPKYFNSNTEECGELIGKRNSVIPKHDFKAEKDVQLLIEDDESRSDRRKLFKIKDHKAKSNIRKKARSLDEQLDTEYRADDDYDGFELDVTEVEAEGYDRTSASSILEDYMYSYVPLSQKKTTRTEMEKKPVKGKLIYEPKVLFTQLNQFDEEFEEVEEYDPNSDSVILFLDNTPFEMEGWEDISDDLSGRTTLFNAKIGALVVFADASYISDDITEFYLKVISLRGELENILDIFTDCKNANEVCHLAEQMFSTKARQTIQHKENYSVYSRPLVFKEILDTNIAEFKDKAQVNLNENLIEECQICFGTSNITRSICGEGFCSSCWALYLPTQVASNKTFLTCPGYECNAPLPLSILTWFLPPTKLLQSIESTLQHILKISFNVFQCPSLNCDKVIKCNNDMVTDFKCKCGFHWCKLCQLSHHAPSSCQENKEFFAYQQKLQRFKSLETVVEGRACPSCKTIWEKMYGCNYMVCNCGTGFCWGCGNVHGSHHGGVCGKINIPLEKIEVLAFPTEDFPKNRIDAFNLSLKLRDNKLRTNHRQVDAITQRFLSADKEWCFTLDREVHPDFFQTERGHRIQEVIRRAVDLCFEGRTYLINAVLRKENKDPRHQKRIGNIYSLLMEFSEDVRTVSVGKDWETCLESVKRNTNYLLVQLKSVGFSNYQ